MEEDFHAQFIYLIANKSQLTYPCRPDILFNIMYTVNINHREQKAIDKLPTQLRQQINEAIEALKVDPRPSGCDKLTNAKEVWRIRVRNYRVGYQIDDAKRAVTIMMVAHRNDFYPKGATH